MSFGNGDGPGRYDPETHTPRLHHDWERDKRVSTVIIEAVAALTDASPTSIGPLYEVVDPDAVDALFAPPPRSRRAESELRFTLNDCEISVYGDGLIEIHVPPEE